MYLVVYKVVLRVYLKPRGHRKLARENTGVRSLYQLLVSHGASNRAANTDQPKQVYRSISILQAATNSRDAAGES